MKPKTPTPPDKGATPHCPRCGRSVPLYGQWCGDCPPDKDELTQKIYEAMQIPYLSERHDAINRLIAKERLDELKLATVGHVTNKNKKNLTYMSGFGYAANNLQEHKNTRLTALQAQADKGEQS